MDDVAIPRAQDLTGGLLGGRYEVLGKLGVGGMASVYEGRRVGLHNRVAIKVLRAELCEDPSNVKRFLREARASSVIEHENIVDILDFGSVDSMPVYFVMEFLEGNDLRIEIKKRGPMKWDRARGILLQVVGALEAAHRKAIVHRDVKPANIFLVRRPSGEDFVKVLDFGIAKVVEETLGGLTQAHTMTNGLLGTVAYMAPEQARGGTIDARTDIYAAGVVAYQMLTGRVPFKGSNPFMVLEQHVNERPQPPSELVTDIPPEAEAVVLRCLEKDPADRFGSMRELAEVLQHARTADYAPPSPVVSRARPTPAPRSPTPAPTTKPATSPAPQPWPAAPVAAATDQPAAPIAHHTEALGSGAGHELLAGAPRHGAGEPASQTERVSADARPKRITPGPSTQLMGATVSTPLQARPAKTQKRRGLHPALFGVGIGAGILGVLGVAFWLRGESTPAPSAGAIDPGTPVAAEVPSDAVAPIDPPVSPPPAAPEVVIAQPKTPVESPPPAGSAETAQAPERPERAHTSSRPKKKRPPRGPAAKPTPPPAEPPAVKPPKTDPDSELHPDLRNPYG